MKVSKIKKTYNDYDVELSWGQLQAIKSALERDHADPVSDELYAELSWYLDHVPHPGEEEEDLKARDEMNGAGVTPESGEGEEGGGGDEGDYPLPMPPGHDEIGAAPGEGGEEGGEFPRGEGEGEEEGELVGAEARSTSRPGEGEGFEEESEERLPTPPAE